MSPFDDLTAAQRHQIRDAHARDKERRTARLVPDVRPDQIWEDNDRRAEGRTLRVEDVRFSARMGEDVAVCTILTNSDSQQKLIDDPPSWHRPVDRRGTRTEIAVRRFRPTSSGYRLVQDVED